MHTKRTTQEWLNPLRNLDFQELPGKRQASYLVRAQDNLEILKADLRDRIYLIFYLQDFLSHEITVP